MWFKIELLAFSSALENVLRMWRLSKIQDGHSLKRNNARQIWTIGRRNSMDETRLNKRVFKWNCLSTYNCKNWNYKIEKIFRDIDIVIHLPKFRNWLFQITTKIDLITDKALAWYKNVWSKTLNLNKSIQKSHGGNKLRSYRNFKTKYETEAYIKFNFLSCFNRSALAKFRLGVAPLRIETGRYESIPEDFVSTVSTVRTLSKMSYMFL